MLRVALVLGASLLACSAWADPVEDAARTAKGAADSIILTGPLGAVFILVVIGLALACLVLGLVIKALWNALGERDAALAKLQDVRAVENAASAREVATTAVAGANAITASNERLADIALRVQTMGDRISAVPESLTRIVANQDKILERLPRGA